VTDERTKSWSGPATARQRRRWVVAAIAAAVAVGLAVWLRVAGRERPERSPMRMTTVKRGVFREVLIQNGRLEAKNIRSVFAQVSGAITWMIAEGTVVKEGDEIVRQDDTQLRRDLDNYIERSYKPAQFALSSEMLTLESTRVELDLSVKHAEINLKLAELARRELEERYADDLEVARLDAQIARIEAEAAQHALDVNAPLVEKGVVSESVLGGLTVTALNAKATEEEAMERLKRLEAGPTILERRAADNAVEIAQDSLATAQFNREADLAIHEAEVAEAKAGLEKAEIEKRQLEQAIEKAVVRAPMSGAVVYVNVWKGSGEMSPIKLGETRTRGQDLLKMADVSTLEVHMLVAEPDALRIKREQAAKIRFVAFPDLALPARVTYVSPDAFDKNQKLGPLALAKLGEAGVKVLEVRLTLLETDPRLRLGLSAVAEIETFSLDNALMIPMSALVFDDGGTYCWVKAGSGFRRTQVKISRCNEMEAVVESGVAEGDVLLDEPAVHEYY
jgi:multidrug resistance efflux pump